MKQNIFKYLSYSLVLLFLLSCKKEKGALDDFDPGKFDYICIWKKNNNADTLVGEVSGPYIQGGSYIFRVKKELINTNNSFSIGRPSKSNPTLFSAQALPESAPVTFSEHDLDHLWVNFQKGDSLIGSFVLTRKE